MSRLAKKPIQIPDGVSVKNDGEYLTVKGPGGEIKTKTSPEVKILLENNKITLALEKNSKGGAATLGSRWALIKNAVLGTTTGFSKVLEIEGVGYKALLEGKNVVLHLGYATPVKIKIPDNIKVEIEKSSIKISGLDKEAVGQFAANIRSLKKPEPYKGKGFRYRGEIIRRKVGKKAGATAAA